MSENKIQELEQRLSIIESKMLTMGALAQDVVSCQRVESELQQRIEFESLIREISTEFINLLPSEIDKGINNALKKVGQFTKADRSYVFTYCEEKQELCNTHEYCAENIEPQIGEMASRPADLFPWSIQELEKKGSLHISSVDQFPSQAVHEKQQFIDNKLQAFAVFTMRINGRMAGFVGFDWIQKSEYYSSTIALLLQVLGVIFSNALERQKEEREKERLIEELQETQEELLTLSIRDQLTGLFNRRHMEESLKREVSRAKRHETSLAIIMLDVDHFKNINDMYGHMAGDVVLQKIGEFLLEHSRGEDVVCRFGGEEFVLIMPGASKQSGEKRANELCVAIREDVKVTYRKTTLPPITVSIGVSVYPDHGNSTDEMIFEADIALYKAKEGGRNRAEMASKIAES